MNALEFLRLVLPPESGRWYVGFAQKPNPDGEEPFRRQWSFQTIEKLHKWLARFDAEGFDVYYACSSFRAERMWSERDQKWHRRSHDNVDKIADLWADIDTQETKPNAVYRNRQEAAQAVLAFCRDARLPVPLWVSSGGGLHLHWPLAALLDLNEWLSYARGLKQLAKTHGLAIDPTRTADASSILRPPGFHHWKTGRIVEASEVERFDLKLFEHVKELGNGQPARNIARPSPSNSNLTRALIGSLRSDPSDPRAIKQYCGQVREFSNRPGSFSEPSHYGFAGLAHWCGPGGADWHDSIIDPEYRELARAKREHWGERYGPPLCSYFHARQYPELCEACPWFKEESTPLQLGRLAEKELKKIFGSQKTSQTADRTDENPPVNRLNGFPVLEGPWNLNEKNQIVWTHEAKDEEPEETIVSEHPIYIDHVHTSEASGRGSYTFKHYLPKEDKWTTINVPAEDMGNGKGIPELLAKRVLVADKRLFETYIREQLGKFQRDMVSHMRFEQFGWKLNDTQFLFGTTLFGPDTNLENVVVSDALLTRTDKLGIGPRPGGNVRIFTSMLNQLFTPDHYCAWANILASFGAIFQRWHNRNEGGIIISNFTAASGRGKTKLLNTAAAIWGMWDALSLKHYDTAASQGLIFSELGNLPVFIDEFAHYATDPQYGVVRMRDLIDMFGAGTDKHRALNSGLGVRPQLGRFQTNLHGASNRSIIDILEVFAASETAPLRRVAEFDASPPADFDPMLGEHLDKALWANSGHAGAAFLYHVTRNLPWCKKALEEWTAAIWKSSGLSADHRFRVRLLGNIMLAGMIARDLGLITPDIDVAAVIEWAIEQIKTRTPSEYQTVTEETSIDALNQFLTHNAVNTLRVQYGYKPGTMQMPLGQKPQKLVIRHESLTGRLFASAHDFKKFIVEAGYSYKDVLAHLHSARILKAHDRLVTLGAGTEYASAQVRCVEFDVTHPALTSTPREVSGAPQAPGSAAARTL